MRLFMERSHRDLARRQAAVLAFDHTVESAALPFLCGSARALGMVFK